MKTANEIMVILFTYQQEIIDKKGFSSLQIKGIFIKLPPISGLLRNKNTFLRADAIFFKMIFVLV